MLKIEVTSKVQIREVSGNTFRNQVCFVTFPDKKYPAEVLIPVPRNAEPYPVGQFTLAPESFFVETKYREQRLQFSPVLVPVSKTGA